MLKAVIARGIELPSQDREGTGQNIALPQDAPAHTIPSPAPSKYLGDPIKTQLVRYEDDLKQIIENDDLDDCVKMKMFNDILAKSQRVNDFRLGKVPEKKFTPPIPPKQPPTPAPVTIPPQNNSKKIKKIKRPVFKTKKKAKPSFKSAKFKFLKYPA